MFSLSKTYVHKGAVPFALGLSLLLTGCKGSSKDANSFVLNQLYKNNIDKTTVKIPSMPLPFIKDAPDHADLGNAGVTISDNLAMNRPVESVEKDFIAKADVYWKLNWMAKVMTQGFVPHDFEDSVEKTKQLLALTYHDSLYPLAMNALEEVQEGLKHQQAEETLTRAGVASAIVPWMSGSLAVEDYIDSGQLGFGGKPKEQAIGFGDANANAAASPDLSMTLEQKQALEIVRNYSSKYKMSPAMMKTQAWGEAYKRIDQFLYALRRHPVSADHPGLDQARTRTAPNGTDYFVQPDMTAGYKVKPGNKSPIDTTTPFNPFGKPFRDN